jgi:hypothetical protein
MKTQTPRSINQNQTAVVESLDRLEKVVMMPHQPRAALNAVFLYEDDETREWARAAYERLCGLAGEHPVRATWWKLNNLFEPGVLAAAVSTAMRAGVVVVAVRAEEGLPLPFYTWVNNWLPHRIHAGGVLVALVGASEQRTTTRSGRVGDYLRTVARQGHLNFLLARNKLSRATLAAQPAINGNGSNGHAIQRLLNGNQRNGHAVRMSIR